MKKLIVSVIFFGLVVQIEGYGYYFRFNNRTDAPMVANITTIGNCDEQKDVDVPVGGMRQINSYGCLISKAYADVKSLYGNKRVEYSPVGGSLGGNTNFTVTGSKGNYSLQKH